MEDQLWKEISMGISRKQKPPFEGREIVLETVQNQYQVFLNPKNFQAKMFKSGHAIFFSFFSTRPSNEYDSAPSRKNSRPLLEVFVSIG